MFEAITDADQSGPLYGWRVRDPRRRAARLIGTGLVCLPVRVDSVRDKFGNVLNFVLIHLIEYNSFFI